MRNIILLSFIVLPGFVLGQNLELGGYLQTDDRIFIKEDYELSWQDYMISLQAQASPSDNLNFFSEIWLRSHGFSKINTVSDLEDKEKLAPIQMELREAYVNIRGLLINSLDLRIGRQRIAWGTADKFNPTDNLNPDDLEDIWNFGRHLGSNSIMVSYYPDVFTLQGVFVPVFTPAVLPAAHWRSILTPQFSMPPGIVINSIYDSIIVPEMNLKQGSTYGLKLSKNLFGFDLSMSYVSGRDDLPITNFMVLQPASDSGKFDIYTKLIYPKLQIFGVDLAGEVKGFGIWAEAGLFFSEPIKMVIDLSAIGMGQIDSLVLEDKPYFKYVTGADYTFRNGAYLNCQYVHGFVNERGNEALRDYFMFGLEWKFFGEKLKLMPINLGVEIDDFKKLKDNYAIIYSPQLVYYPFDNNEISLGARLIDGKNTTTFGRAKDNDEAFVQVKFSF
ncbi:MAG: hypothetical protein ACUVQ4_00375 [bacterium]